MFSFYCLSETTQTKEPRLFKKKMDALNFQNAYIIGTICYLCSYIIQALSK